jgi:hypothetical protein
MNAEPHVHELEIHFDRDGDAHVTYGDQSKLVWRRWGPWEWIMPFEGRIRRSAKRMVRRHDRESVKAGKRGTSAERVAVEVGRSKWADTPIKVTIR